MLLIPAESQSHEPNNFLVQTIPSRMIWNRWSRIQVTRIEVCFFVMLVSISDSKLRGELNQMEYDENVSGTLVIYYQHEVEHRLLI